MAEFYQVKQNKFYTENVEYIDYKDYKTLQRYINSVGKIESRKRTGASMKHQRISLLTHLIGEVKCIAQQT